MTQVNDVRDAHVETTPAPAVSPWQPLSQPVFRMLWIATVVSNVGSWMSDVGINWSMLTLSADPLDIALVQAASSLPMFLFALPSGVMADIVDRRKYLLFSQLWVFIAAAGLTLLSFTGHVTPTVLLAATFLLSVGAAMSSPPFQAIVPDLVSKPELGSAVALNSLGVNISRAIGPALGGFSAVACRAVDGVCPERAVRDGRGVGAVALASGTVRAAFATGALLLCGALRDSLRARRAGAAQRAGAHRGLFCFRQRGLGIAAAGGAPRAGLRPGGLRRDAGVYRPWRHCRGHPAAASAPAAERRSADGGRQPDVCDHHAGAGICTSLLAAKLVEFFTGFAWIAVLSTLNLGAQRSAARWVKARALAVYLTVFFGSMTAGSAVWGQIASQFGTPASLVVATLGMVLASMTVFRWKLEKDPDLNLDLSGQPLDGVEIELPNERGPVLVSHEYIIDPQNAKAFLQAVHELRRVRRRAGAMSWAVYEDIERPGLFIETFLMGSWIEHLRQQERHTMNDLLLQSRVLAFHQGTTSPAIRYLVAPV